MKYPENLEASWQEFKTRVLKNVPENSIQMREMEKAFKCGVIGGLSLLYSAAEKYPEEIAEDILKQFFKDFEVYLGTLNAPYIMAPSKTSTHSPSAEG